MECIPLDECFEKVKKIYSMKGNNKEKKDLIMKITEKCVDIERWHYHVFDTFYGNIEPLDEYGWSDENNYPKSGDIVFGKKVSNVGIFTFNLKNCETILGFIEPL